MYFYNIFSFYQLLGSMDSIFKCFGGLGRLWELWGHFWSTLGTILAHFEHFGLHFGSFLRPLGTFGRPFGVPWTTLVPTWKKYKNRAISGRNPSPCWPHFGTFVSYKSECVESVCLYAVFSSMFDGFQDGPTLDPLTPAQSKHSCSFSKCS